ncbi:MAG: pantetheine-phosphate adenylyltransferase [Chloroflexi bacterium]|nr:pantetheine-phosphate adenylyltransferase [Chloroflexota bacterium]
MPIAIYPGSFDPITNGHLDIAQRAARLFDRLVIGVYDIPAKRLLFTTEERVALSKQAVKERQLGNVEVRAFTGLTVDFAKRIGATVEVRGLRMSADFEREFEMALMNKNLAPDLELVCLMASLNYQFLSSSLLKEVASLGGNIDDLVPKHIAKALVQKYRQGKLQANYPEKETPV